MLAKLGKCLLTFLVVTIISLAVLLNVVRLLTPLLNDHKDWVAHWVGQIVHLPVEVGSVKASWLGFQPAIKVSGLAVRDKQQHTLLQLGQFTASVDLWASLLKRQWLPGRLAITHVRLLLNQDAHGEWFLNSYLPLSQQTEVVSALRWSDMLSWLVLQSDITVQDLQLLVKTAKGQTALLDPVRIRSFHNGKAHHVALSMRLQQVVPSTLKATFTFNQAPFDAPNFKAAIYVVADQVQLAQWATWPGVARWLAGTQLTSGTGRVQWWGQWSSQKITDAHALLHLKNVVLATPTWDSQLWLNRLGANVYWHRTEMGWELTADQIQAAVNHYEWAQNQLLLRYRRDPKDQQAHWQLGFDHLPLSDVAWLAQHMTVLPKRWRQLTQQLAPSGQLSDTVLAWQEAVRPHLTALTMHFSDLAWQPNGYGIGVQGLSGDVRFDGRTTHFKLAQLKQLQLTRWLKQPIELNEAQALGSLSWQGTAGWQLSLPHMVLADQQGRVTGHDLLLRHEPGKGVSGNVRLKLAMKDMSRLKNYLPHQGMPAALDQWLHQAFLAGAVQGEFLWQGRLDQWPYRQGGGHLLARLQVDEASLRYDPAWPEIDDIHAKVNINNQHLVIHAAQANTKGVDLEHITAQVADLTEGLLDIRGDYRGQLAAGRQFLRASPLEVGEQLQPLALAGAFNGQLRLRIPLHSQKLQPGVAGWFAVQDASLSWPDTPLNVTNLNGRFSYSDHDFQATAVRGQWLGQPMQIKLSSRQRGNQIQAVQVALSGRLPLARLGASSMLQRMGVQGLLPYQANLYLYPNARHQSNRLDVRSNLQGVMVSLPEPLAKRAEQLRSMHLQVRLSEKKPIEVTAQYAKLAQARLLLKPQKDGWLPDKLGIVIGQGEPHLPKQQGVNLQVKLPAINASAWQQYLQRQQEGASTATSLPLRQVTLDIGKMMWLGQVWTGTHVQAAREAKVWRVKLKSDVAEGQLTIPDDQRLQVLRAHFKRLHYSPLKHLSDQSAVLDPKQLPAMDLAVDDLVWRGRRLGQLHLLAEHVQQGLRFSRLALQGAGFQLQSKGQWLKTKTSAFVEASGRLMSRDWGRLLHRLKITEVLAGGRGVIGFHLKWPGGPRDFSLQAANGEMNADVRDGKVVQLSAKTESELGLGKMLNLLSLQSLPRRLMFNFSDLTQKGFEFTHLHGAFTLKKGQASTASTIMEGPLAKVDMHGQVELVKKRYNLQLFITPHVTGSLPLIATLTGGPIAGAVTWVLDKLFVGRTVGRAAQVRYYVGGTWDHPAIKKIG